MIRENIKNILKGITEKDFKEGKADLHIHSCMSDGVMTPEEILQQALKRNMKYIAISDHNCTDAYKNDEVNKCEILIPAIEFDCLHMGVLIHILCYGADINNERLKKLYAKNTAGKKHNLYRLFHLRNPREVIEAIRESGGISVLAHPACYWTPFIDSFTAKLVEYGLDGIETYYPYRGLRGILKFHNNEKIKETAEKYGLIKTGGSDSHGKFLL